MKMINAGPVGPVTSNFGNYLFNCTRNKQCQRAYFMPTLGLSNHMFYVDLAGKPLTYQASVMDLCTPDCEGGTPGDFNFDYNYDFLIGEGCLPTGTDFVFNSYVAGQKPDGTWYAVFGSPSDVATPNYFFVRIVVNVDGVEYVYYSEMFEKDTCDTLALLRGCYPNEPVGASATDCNGVYYGFPTNNDPLGSPNFRYVHSGYVRKASVIDSEEKLTISLFNSRRPYKTTVTRGKVLEFELVPPFYKDHLLPIFARGVVQIDSKEYTLQEEQSWSVLSRESKLWAMDVLLGSECRQVFGCAPSDCELPAGACGGSPTDVSIATQEGVTTFTLLNGAYSAGDRVDWIVREGNVLIDSGIVSSAPWEFIIDAAIHTDFDPATKCYSVEWKKTCADGTQGATQTKQFGDCSEVELGPCHTYLLTYNGPEVTFVEYMDCDNVHQEFYLMAGTSQRICALENSLEIADEVNTVIDDEGEGCSPGAPLCYLYNILCDSDNGAVVWYEQCTEEGGQFFSFNMGNGELVDICSRSVPYAEQGHIIVGQAPAECTP